MTTTNCTTTNIDRILEISTKIPTVQINGRTESKLRHGGKIHYVMIIVKERIENQ